MSENFKYDNIHILNNLSEKGIMYSFSIGTIVSKGQYLLYFKSGYTLAKKNTLATLYRLANRQNLDVLEFNLLINMII